MWIIGVVIVFVLLLAGEHQEASKMPAIGMRLTKRQKVILKGIGGSVCKRDGGFMHTKTLVSFFNKSHETLVHMTIDNGQVILEYDGNLIINVIDKENIDEIYFLLRLWQTLPDVAREQIKKDHPSLRL